MTNVTEYPLIQKSITDIIYYYKEMDCNYSLIVLLHLIPIHERIT